MALQNFHNVALAPYISFGAKIKIKFQTVVQQMREGHEERIGEWQDPLWSFDIGPALRDQADLESVIAFFRARNGPEFIFKFQNPIDYQVTNETFAFGTGTTTTFQLCRRYNSGIAGDGVQYVRPISLPDSGLLIYDNGVLQTSGVTVDLEGGLVTFTTPPTSGHTLSWTGTYHVPVRFVNTSIYSIIEVYENFEQQILLVEERVPLSNNILSEAQPPDFVEARFPDHYAARASIGPEMLVVVTPSDSGYTNRTMRYSEPKVRFSVEETERSLAQLQTILSFFLNRKGRLVGFRLKDITDYQAINQFIGTGDNTTTTFQLRKRYTSGSQTGTRTILKPNNDITVYIDGVPATPQPSINTTSGIITFSSAPASGVAISWTGTYDVPVRFDSDELTLSIKGVEWFNMESMGFAEISISLPNITVDTSISQPRAILSGCAVAPYPLKAEVQKYISFATSGSATSMALDFDFFARARNAPNITVGALVSHVTSTFGAIFRHVQNGAVSAFALRMASGLSRVDSATGGINIAPLFNGGSLSWNCGPGSPLVNTFSGLFTAPGAFIDTDMHAFIATMDWSNRLILSSGATYGIKELEAANFVVDVCQILDSVPTSAEVKIAHNPISSYYADTDNRIAGGNYTSLSDIGSQRFSGRLYELVLFINKVPSSEKSTIVNIHLPVLQYWGSKYGANYRHKRNFDVQTTLGFWWRADENVTLHSGDNRVSRWGDVGNKTAFIQNDFSVGSTGHPEQASVVSLPEINEVLHLADGKVVR